MLSLLYIYCLCCLSVFNLLKINQLLRNFPLILHVYFVSLKIISEHLFFIARMLFCQFHIKSKGLNWYLREYMREWEFMSLWALLILIYDLNPNLREWFGGNLREWFEAKKFFCLWTWLYILYIRGTQALRQGPNFHSGKILKI